MVKIEELNYELDSYQEVFIYSELIGRNIRFVPPTQLSWTTAFSNSFVVLFYFIDEH